MKFRLVQHMTQSVPGIGTVIMIFGMFFGRKFAEFRNYSKMCPIERMDWSITRDPIHGDTFHLYCILPLKNHKSCPPWLMRDILKSCHSFLKRTRHLLKKPCQACRIKSLSFFYGNLWFTRLIPKRSTLHVQCWTR